MGQTASSGGSEQFKRMAPLLGGSAVSDEDQKPCTSFKPLFAHGTQAVSTQPQEDKESHEELLERAYQEGLQKGQLHGCQQAHDMARASLAPGLTAFMKNLDDFLSQSDLSQAQFNEGAITLALLIVEKITGQTASIADHDFGKLKTAINEALLEINRISINMNPDDLDELETFIAADGVGLPDEPRIAIQKNSSIQHGELRVEEQSDHRERLDKRILEEFDRFLASL